MCQLYKVVSRKQVDHRDPLHVDNFFPDKQRVHLRTRNKRQDLILYLANLHSTATQTGMPLGMIHIPMRLMSLRDWCQDYRVVLDVFFNVQQLGFNLGDGNHEISTLVPKRLTLASAKAASRAAATLVYSPGDEPESKVVSKVFIRQSQREVILKRLLDEGRLDLHSPVDWLLARSTVNFHFEPAGKLKLRDSSVWPIRGIETWPSWLRVELFGDGIDIDSAYTQFMIEQLHEVYREQPRLLTLLYPDLLRSLADKRNWRAELCQTILGLEVTEPNIGKVKRICMALANGSRVSPAVLIGSRNSEVAELILQAVEDVSPINLIRIGKRFEAIGKQYIMARKAVCAHLLRLHPSRINQKQVFSSYFEWERAARYLIWEAIGRHGIMVHDGIDGVPQSQLDRLPEIMKELNLRLTV